MAECDPVTCVCGDEFYKDYEEDRGKGEQDRRRNGEHYSIYSYNRGAFSDVGRVAVIWDEDRDKRALCALKMLQDEGQLDYVAAIGESEGLLSVYKRKINIVWGLDERVQRIAETCTLNDPWSCEVLHWDSFIVSRMNKGEPTEHFTDMSRKWELTLEPLGDFVSAHDFEEGGIFYSGT